MEMPQKQEDETSDPTSVGGVTSDMSSVEGVSPDVPQGQY